MVDSQYLSGLDQSMVMPGYNSRQLNQTIAVDNDQSTDLIVANTSYSRTQQRAQSVCNLRGRDYPDQIEETNKINEESVYYAKERLKNVKDVLKNSKTLKE